ncbi:MAG: TetR/AcrR family transcriptional regulator [Bacillota bacterium]
MARIAKPEEVARMRTKLIRAAYEEMVAKGCQAVTIGDVARRAGVSKGLPLYYFASKEELLAAVMERTTQLIILRVKRALRSKREPLAQIEAYLEAMILRGDHHRDFYRVYLDFLNLGLRNPRIGATAREFLVDCRAIEEQIIAAGIAAGQFRPDLDPVQGSAAVRGLIDGLSLQWLFHPDEPFESFRLRLRAAVLHYLAA